MELLLLFRRLMPAQVSRSVSHMDSDRLQIWMGIRFRRTSPLFPPYESCMLPSAQHFQSIRLTVLVLGTGSGSSRLWVGGPWDSTTIAWVHSCTGLKEKCNQPWTACLCTQRGWSRHFLSRREYNLRRGCGPSSVSASFNWLAYLLADCRSPWPA